MTKNRFDYHLNNVIPEWLTAGIFSALETAMGESLPWSPDISESLDLDYHGNHSGEKIISPLLFNLIKNNDDEELTDIQIAAVASLISARFGPQWTRLYAVLSSEYDPIQNYSMTEIMEDDTKETTYGHTDTRTDNLSESKTGTETLEAGTETTTETDIYGFDSSEPSPSNKETVSNDGDDVTRFNTTVANTGTQGHVEGGKDTEVRNYELTRSGNIGVTTSQQMLQSEIDLWQYDFFKIVYADIDKVLCLDCY